ncbi:glycosyltransferase [Microbacterium yannicii]|uniref:Glycosyltransferase n=1 Tax=Microbacterium yannicii TaxID=671622 RepID=A0ABP9MCW9_9MICO|nr:glycosyltransferase [Microbacterium yannicii]MCO5952802.1 glycosyltransferase [Microbacterium yannicii]
MTKILHVVECYGAGVGRAVQLWAKLTPEHEHHLLWEGEESPTGEHAFASASRMPTGLFRRAKAVDAQVENLRPDLVIAHSSWAGVYARARRLDAPVAYAPHAYKFEDTSESRIRRAIYRFAEARLTQRSRVTLALTPHEESLARSLDSAAVTHIVPNSPTVTPDDGGNTTGFDPGRRVLMIGRISPQKDPGHFIEVSHLVRQSRPDVEFVWAGEGDPELTRRLQQAQIAVTGWLSRDALIDLLSQASVYYHSAIYEGFPLSVLDAGSFEHPIVVRAISPFDGIGLVAAGSAGEAAEMILSVLDRGPVYDLAVRGTRALRASMNRQSQVSAMRSLLERFSGEPGSGRWLSDRGRDVSAARGAEAVET